MILIFTEDIDHNNQNTEFTAYVVSEKIPKLSKILALIFSSRK